MSWKQSRGWMVVVALVWSGPVGAQVQESGQQPVVISASGGTSKGAYQAGVNWALMQYLKEHRGNYDLKAVTGASAGNVDALLVALEWCLAEATAAEDSMLWKTWTRTGLAQLMPSHEEDAQSELAVFDRAFFDHVQKTSLLELIGTKEKGARKVWREKCEVPVGLTLTATTPIPIDAGAGVPIMVQRYAAVFVVKVIDGRPEFLPFAPLRDMKSLGALALMPAPDSGCPVSGFDWVFEVIKASSAFPVAFAPVQICYQPGGLAFAGGVRTDAFVDGGVFDNNPFGLATTLFDIARDLSAPLQTVRVFYTNPMNFRGALQQVEASKRRGSAANEGLAGTLAMIRGAMGAARHYELQSALRQQERDRDMGANRDVHISASSRSLPIMGETLGSFGAFLGRPFREYDFYSGVSDGFHMVAQELLCKGDADRWRTCMTKAFEQQIAGLPANSHARDVVAWRRSLELAEKWDSVSGKSARDNKHVILAAIHEEVRKTTLEPRAYESCEVRGFPLGKALCESGLESVITSLGSSSVWPSVAAERCLADVQAGSDRRGREYWVGDARTGACFVDREFKQLIQDREQEVLRLVDRALERLRFGEEQLEKRKAPQMDGWSETVDMLHRSSSARYRTGWSSILPSSFGPRRFGLNQTGVATIVALLFPSHVSVGVLGESDVRPQLLLGTRLFEVRSPLLYVASDLEFPNREDTSWAWSQRTHTAALGTYAIPWRLPVDSFELQLLNVGTLRKVGGGVARSWGVGGGFTMAKSKVRVDVRWTKATGTVAQLGISDVRGMLGWWVR